MTRDEVKAVLYSINANYPSVKTTPEEAKNRIDLWFNEFKDYDTNTIVEAVKLHMVDPKVGMFYPSLAHVVAKIQRAENLIALTATTRAMHNAPQRAQLPRNASQAHATYKHLVAEFDEAERRNMTCTRRAGAECPIECFKAYREKNKCEQCTNTPKQLNGGST